MPTLHRLTQNQNFVLRENLIKLHHNSLHFYGHHCDFVSLYFKKD